MSKHYDLQILLFAVLGIAISASAMAATSKAEYRQALAGAKAEYKKEYAACPAAAGSERLACRRQAYKKLETAQADAREAHGMPRNAEGPRAGGG